MKFPALPLPTALVLIAFILGWVALAYLKVPIPMWMVAVGGGFGHIVTTYMSSGRATTGGSGSGQAPGSDSNSNTSPPTAGS